MKTFKKIFYTVLAVLFVLALGSRIIETGDPAIGFYVLMALLFFVTVAIEGSR